MNKLSSQTSRLVPQFIRDENPTFFKFIQTYLEFIESYYKDQNKSLPTDEQTELRDPYDLISNLIINHDIDLTSKLFLEHYKRTYLAKFFYDGEIWSFAPTGTSTNFRFLIKKIRDFYLSKGSINSIQFFFRSIYGVSADIYIPKFDILRASDGTWFEPIVLYPEEAILIDSNQNETIIPIKQRLSQVLGISEWSSSEYYNIGERVWHDPTPNSTDRTGQIWVSNKNINRTEPNLSSADWSIFVPTRNEWLELYPLRNELITSEARGYIRDIRQPKLPEWESAVTYKLNSLVRYNEQDWIATGSTQGDIPDQSSSWEVYDTPFYIELDNTTGFFRQGARVEMRDPLLVDSTTLATSENDLVLATFKLGLSKIADEWIKFESESDLILKEYTGDDRVSLNLTNYVLPETITEPYYLSPEEDPETFEVLVKNNLQTQIQEAETDPSLDVIIRIRKSDDADFDGGIHTVGEPVVTVNGTEQTGTNQADGLTYPILDIDDTTYETALDLEDDLNVRVPNGITWDVIDISNTGQDLAIAFSGIYDSTTWVEEPDQDFNNVLEEPGLWLDRAGFISDSSKVIQDNIEFQDFSYKISVPIDKSIFEKNFQDNIHPTGLYFWTEKTAGPPAQIGGFNIDVSVEQFSWIIEWASFKDLNIDTSHEISYSERFKWHNLSTVTRSTIDYSYVEQNLSLTPNWNTWEVAPQRVSIDNIDFSGGPILFQAGATSELTVSQTTPSLTVGQWYEIITECTSWTSGAIKLTEQNGDIILADSVDVTTKLFQAESTDLEITAVAGTDLEINLIRIKEVEMSTGPNETVKFISDFLLYGGYNHTLAFRSFNDQYKKLSSSDDRFSISNNSIYYNEIDDVGHATERQLELRELIFFHLYPRQRTSYIEDLIAGDSYTVGSNNTLIDLTVNEHMIHRFDTLDLDNILLFVNGRLAPTSDYTISFVTGGISLKLLKSNNDFIDFYGSEFENVEFVFLDDHNFCEREFITVPANTELTVNHSDKYNSRNRENFLVFQNGLLAEQQIIRKQFKYLVIQNDTANEQVYELVKFNELSNNLINRIEIIEPVIDERLISTDSFGHTSYVTEIIGQHKLNQHTTARTYNRKSPNIFSHVPDLRIMDAVESQDGVTITGDVLITGDLSTNESQDNLTLNGDVLITGDLATNENSDSLTSPGGTVA